MEKTKMEEMVLKILNDKLHYCKQKDGSFEIEIYADYRDKMGSGTAIEICTSDDPELALWEKMNEWYFDADCYECEELMEEIQKELEKEGLCAADEDELRDIINEWVYWDYPMDHYLNQEFCVNIMLDTGDGNYDFSMNSPYPCYCGRYEDRLDEKSSLLWLARQQGYTKTQLWQALREGDMENPKGFLESCRVEVANLSSSLAAVTFLVRMTLRELMELNRCIRLQDRNGQIYDATKRPYCGYIVLDKRTMVGLYDSWNGGGSVLEIELEKDVRIPIRFIHSALPDGGDGYSIDDVYGMCGSAWREGMVKKIHAPNNINELEGATCSPTSH